MRYSTREDKHRQSLTGFPTAPQSTAGVGHLRWMICGLLFLATTINYVDRQVLGILAVPLQREIGWSEADYGLIVSSFQAAYAIGLLVFGGVIDNIGTRLGYCLCIVWWSVAAMAHAFARSPLGFGIARFALGLGEAGNFPAAIRTIAEWFPKGERAFATGIFNSGSSVGAILTPLIVPWIALHWGWRWAFLLTGSIGFVWLALWVRFYQRPTEHPLISTAELAHIQSDRQLFQLRIPWKQLIPHRQTWALLSARFLTDPIWWFYLYWIPKFLHAHNGINLEQLALPLIAIYLSADAGSIFGGWLSSALIGRGCSTSAARKTAMLVCALLVTPIVLAPWASNIWVEVLLLSLATAGHQGWAANIFTVVSDMFPVQAVASVIGMCGFAGSIGGMLAASATGFLLQATGNYLPVFVFAASGYLVALGVLHVVIGDFKTVDAGLDEYQTEKKS
jgi:MFS transporter, ACS family, hexuronate transporter